MRTTKCTVSLLAAAAALALCGSVRAVDFALGFDGCPTAPATGTANAEYTNTLTGTLTSSNNTGADGAQGWSFGCQITNGDFAGFDTTITISTLYQKTSGGALTEKDLVIDDAGFYSAELTAGNTGFVTGIVFSTSKKQVLHPEGKVGTVHLNCHSTYPADGADDKAVTVEYKSGLQGSGQPVDLVVTFNSDSITPTSTSCVTTLSSKVPPPPAPVFTLGFDGCPAASKGLPDSNADYMLTGTLASVLDGNTDPLAEGAQGWSFGCEVTNGEFASFDTTITISTLFQKTTGAVLTEKDLVIDDAGFYSAELIPVTGTPKTGFTTGIVFSTSKKQVLHANTKVGTVHLNVHSTYPADGASKDVTVAYKPGLQGSGQPVDLVVTYNSDSKTPGTASCAVTLTGEAVIVKPKATFRQGDANSDGKIDIADPIFIVYAVVPGLDTAGIYKFACAFAADANKDGSVNLADAIWLIDYEFRGGVAPAPGCVLSDKDVDDTCPESFVCK
jgi:hypothetical protein